jgi:hypothetical protein
MRIDPETFRRAPWHVHRFLAGVPLHDVWQFHLDGGGPGRDLGDFRALMNAIRPGPAVRLLFGLRRALGAALRLDDRRPSSAPPPTSYVHRLDADERARSLAPPGSDWGIFRLVYAFPDEALGEIVNATVHAFSFMGMAPAPGGYRVHWGIYVRPVGRITGPYIALIDPFRRWLIYPALVAKVERAWRETYPRSG